MSRHSHWATEFKFPPTPNLRNPRFLTLAPLVFSYTGKIYSRCYIHSLVILS